MYQKQNRYNQEDTTETLGEKIVTSILFIACIAVLNRLRAICDEYCRIVHIAWMTLVVLVTRFRVINNLSTSIFILYSSAKQLMYFLL